jgi:hypothetical protein
MNEIECEIVAQKCAIKPSLALASEIFWKMTLKKVVYVKKLKLKRLSFPEYAEPS